MPTTISVIYDNPTDADDFEEGYVELVPLAKAMPGLQHLHGLATGGVRILSQDIQEN
jgi:hypothetical protein